ncbi:MAG TPA: site-2 protease family protein [Chloroflexi bacterium]|nr:site-2 protease family protein [Chloroflexota bacterium]
MEEFEAVLEDIRWAVERVFRVESITRLAQPPGALRFRGRLLYESKKAYELLSRELRRLGYTPLFRKDEEGQSILVIPGVIEETPSNKVLSIVLFAFTALSVFFVGLLMDERPNPVSGALFAIALLGSLLAHEMGHYFVARLYGSQVSLPYFIPMPLSPFGTMGAVIRMKSPPLNRQTLMYIGAAGPLAGLIVGLPMLIIGLTLSNVEPLPAHGPFYMEGNSILYALIKYLIFGRFLPSEGMDVFLHPMAFAGWVSIMVTGLNLIPAGQLDGGHIAYAVLGKKARFLTLLIIIGLLILGFFWNGWFLWAILVAVFGRYHARPLDEITPLEPKHYLMALMMLIIFALIFTPKPLVVVP